MAIENEVKFLNINKEEVVSRIKEAGGKDQGEFLMEEMIFYDKELKWIKENKFIRLRAKGSKLLLSYKHHQKPGMNGTEEIEIEMKGDIHQAKEFFETVGFHLYRHQEKYRHTFLLGDVVLDIDTWPNIPTYIEIEGLDEKAIREAAEKIGFNWNEAVHNDARTVIRDLYNLDLDKVKVFTFDKLERI